MLTEKQWCTQAQNLKAKANTKVSTLNLKAWTFEAKDNVMPLSIEPEQKLKHAVLVTAWQNE